MTHGLEPPRTAEAWPVAYGQDLGPEPGAVVEEPHLRTADGRRRAVIEHVTPSVDGGRFPAKRVLGDRVRVEADAFADGHDVVMAVLLHRPPGDESWVEIAMHGPDNDRWWAEFTVDRLGRHRFTVQAWVDRFATWRRDLRRRIEAGQDVTVDLLIGAELIETAAGRARETGDDARRRPTWRRGRPVSGLLKPASAPDVRARRRPRRPRPGAHAAAVRDRGARARDRRRPRACRLLRLVRAVPALHVARRRAATGRCAT